VDVAPAPRAHDGTGDGDPVLRADAGGPASEGLGLVFLRCDTVDRHPAFVDMIVSMVVEKVGHGAACVSASVVTSGTVA
jgi:hypothetical protein